MNYGKVKLTGCTCTIGNGTGSITIGFSAIIWISTTLTPFVVLLMDKVICSTMLWVVYEITVTSIELVWLTAWIVSIWLIVI